MLYLKEKFNNVEIKATITSDNVFCRRPRCGKEVKVDLNVFFDDEDFDLDILGVYCDKCSKKVTKC